MKNKTNKSKRVIRAWAITVADSICNHEDTMSIYRTRKEAKAGMMDGHETKCTGDTVLPVEIHIVSR